MRNSAFELGELIDKKKVEYKLHQPLWDKVAEIDVNLDFNQWTKIKYLNNDATDFHPDIRIVPNNCGGLYLFSIECPVLEGVTSFPVYIGRAQLTPNQNLRKRVREYFTTFARQQERPKVTRMIKYWGADLTISFLPLDNNNQVVDLEERLINSLLLPFNDQIPNKEIQQAVNAFQ